MKDPYVFLIAAFFKGLRLYWELRRLRSELKAIKILLELEEKR